jgi:hypothetical protein
MAREMTERVAISETTKEKLKEFKDGAGVSFDEAIAMLLELATLEGEDLKGSGLLLRFAKERGQTIRRASIEQK